MSKYEDTPAAIAMILFTLGGIFYVFHFNLHDRSLVS